MKKTAKRLMSLVLSISLLIAVLMPAFTSSAIGSDAPNIYIQGQGHWLFSDKDNSGSPSIYPLNVEEDYIKNCITDALPYLAKAVFLNQWDPYYDALLGYVTPIFEGIVLNSDGETKDNSGVHWKATSKISDTKRNGGYDIDSYNFVYDWRIDPYDVADTLETYVNNVLSVTGATKVNLVSRCLGTNIVLTYLQKYGDSKVNSTVLYTGTMDGLSTVGTMFAGDPYLDSGNIKRFADAMLGDDLLMTLIKDTISYFKESYKLDLGIDVVELVYKKIKDNVFDKLLLASYATMPGMWTMVSNEYFEEAKTYIFGENCENTNPEYAGLIRKINNYHYNVQVNAKDMLQKFKDEGMKIYLIAKYGFQSIPLSTESSYQGDDYLEVYSASYGATSSKMGTTFDSNYYNNAVSNSTAKYISPDGMIDASTCLFPDSTWFICGLDHKLFPASVDQMMLTMLAFDGQMTVNDNPNYPQYLVYGNENDTLTPMDATNITVPETTNIFKSYFKFLKSLFAYIKYYIGTLQNKDAA